MSPLKFWLLAIIVLIALAEVGIGGLSDMIGTRIFGISSTHGWVDGAILIGLALVISISMK
jgi:hypothetical protein